MPRILHLRCVDADGLSEPSIVGAKHAGHRYDVRLTQVHPADETRGFGRTRRHRVSVIDVPRRGPTDVFAFWRIVRKIRDFRPHLLHTYDARTNALGLALGRLFKTPVVATLAATESRNVGSATARWRRWLLGRMDHIIVDDHGGRETLAGLKLGDERVSMVEIGVDTERFTRRFDVAQAKQHFGLAPRRAVIGYVGRGECQREIEILLAAVERLTLAGHDCGLLCALAPDDEQRLIAAAANRRLSRHVQAIDLDQAGPLFFHAADVYVAGAPGAAPSRTLLEAMSIQTPVVAAAVADRVCALENGANALVLREFTAAQLAAAIALVLADEPLSGRLTAAARRIVEDRYSLKLRAGRIREIYDAVLDRRNRAATINQKNRKRIPAR